MYMNPLFQKWINYTLLRRKLPIFFFKLFNDIDLMELLRLTGKEFQDITVLKDMLWDLNIYSRGSGNLSIVAIRTQFKYYFDVLRDFIINWLHYQ